MPQNAEPRPAEPVIAEAGRAAGPRGWDADITLDEAALRAVLVGATVPDELPGRADRTTVLDELPDRADRATAGVEVTGDLRKLTGLPGHLTTPGPGPDFALVTP